MFENLTKSNRCHVLLTVLAQPWAEQDVEDQACVRRSPVLSVLSCLTLFLGA